ncbi:site-specific DNA-methyltransferase [Romboutsia sp. 1001216sp1]|nr:MULTISPECIES: site-specific DNA-methyltransferase [unclassified Romboutsia]MDB8790667.1 site-specific DNA-methyltransferase [Romboutsia sp. 1001216sp1]MDB8803230.1 site-specific DNA-methyltransferase [Romboutsia sp. 1001216sp1]MDB8814606.1 site-specific DNA-methyltransferase [Romboutsia sp. 1001216sp1]
MFSKGGDFINIKRYEIYNGECISIMQSIKDKSIDLILCDLPYGTTDCKWDNIIPFDLMWEQYHRIIKDNGAIVLFSAQPFTTKLINSNLKNYRYSWYWMKNTCTGFAFAKHQPMRKIEDINVFYKRKPLYIPQGLKKLDKPKVKKRKSKISNKDTIYNEDTLMKEHIVEYTNYPNNVLEFKKESKTVHPTQKPVDLLEYLIKTYTMEGDIVLDNCMGSGSVGVATGNTNRKFIGIELDNTYFEIAKNRIEKAYL